MKLKFSFLVLLFLWTGCAQQCVHQSMLLQENRRLENALYITHAQLAEVKKENEALQADSPSLKKMKKTDDFDNIPLYEIPKIEIPNSPGTTVPPALLKSGQIPVWSPARSRTE